MSEFLPALFRELDASPLTDPAQFAPILAATSHCLATAPGHRCARCCHWSLPLAPPYIGRDLPHGVALRFNEWLVWHLHVIRHQGGVLVS